MNIIEKLKQMGVEITQEIEKQLAGEYLSELEVQKKVTKAENDRDSWKKRAEDAEGTLEGFEGKDFDAMKKERDDWKERAEKAEKDYEQKINERDYADAVQEHVKDITFSSESAKKAYIADLKAAGLTMKDGKIYGLKDFYEAYEKGDPDAFVSEEQQRAEGNKAVFTSEMSSKLPKPGTKVSPEKLMQMKNENPTLDISQYM